MKAIFYVIGVSAVFANPVFSKKPEKSGLELQQIQSRDFEVSKEITFPAVMSVLQDAGYRINAADRDTGLITGQGSASGKITYNILFGVGNKKRSPIVSAYIEPRGPNASRVRLNFVMAVTKSSLYGMRAADEEPVEDPATYAEAFEKINQAVFIRQSVDSSAQPASTTPSINSEAVVAPAK